MVCGWWTGITTVCVFLDDGGVFFFFGVSCKQKKSVGLTKTNLSGWLDHTKKKYTGSVAKIGRQAEDHSQYTHSGKKERKKHMASHVSLGGVLLLSGGARCCVDVGVGMTNDSNDQPTKHECTNPASTLQTEEGPNIVLACARTNPRTCHGRHDGVPNSAHV